MVASRKWTSPTCIFTILFAASGAFANEVTCETCATLSPPPPECAALSCPAPVTCEDCATKVPPPPKCAAMLCLPDACICTKEFMPVCGISSKGKMHTYSNKCEATCGGAFCWRDGPCSQWRRPKKMKETCNRRMCSEDYSPVCGIHVGGKKQTYSNTCFAEYPCAFCYNMGACSNKTQV